MKSFLTIIVDKNEIVLNVCSRARPEIVPVWSLAIVFRLGGVAGWRREANERPTRASLRGISLAQALFSVWQAGGSVLTSRAARAFERQPRRLAICLLEKSRSP